VTLFDAKQTRNQAVAGIADRTASRHLWGLRDVIGHVTNWYPVWHFLLVGPLEPNLYLYRFPIYSTSNVTQWLTWPRYDL